MALGFFRRHQKMVFVIMVLLMAAFGIPAGYKGCSGMGGCAGNVGKAGGATVSPSMVRQAQLDLQLLGSALQAAGQTYPFQYFQQRNQTGDRVVLWALLVHEARTSGVRVTDADVSQLLKQVFGERYKQELANLAIQKISEDDLRAAARDYLLVIRGFEGARVTTPPSVGEIDRALADVSEKIQLGMVLLPADDFTKGLPDPTPDEIKAQFDKCRGLVAQGPGNNTEFGFGYRLTDRADVAWVFVDQDLVRRGIRPTEAQMAEYWRQHRGELTKPASGPTTGTAPVEEAPIEKYSEARPQIRRILQDTLAQNKLAELLQRARELIAHNEKSPAPYQRAADEMVKPAPELLATKAPSQPAGATLEEVVDDLSNQTGVAVVFPYQAGISVDPKLKLDTAKLPKNATLGQVLEALAEQAKLPKIQWVSAAGLENVLFAGAPVNLVPVTAGRTGLVDLRTLWTDPLLAAASLSDRPRSRVEVLPGIVETAGAFQADKERSTGMIDPGQDFRQAMFVAGRHEGRLLWRLVAAEPAHDPQALTEEVRKDVVRDIHIAKAFAKAQQEARRMLEQVRAGADPEALAQQQKLSYTKTQPFARKRLTMSQTSVDMIWQDVPGVGVSPTFMEQAFALASPAASRPASLAASGATRTTASASAPAVAADVVSLPRQRKVVLIKKLDFQPATREDQQQNRFIVTSILRNQQNAQALESWFNGERIMERTQFKPAKAKDQQPSRRREPEPEPADYGF